MTQDKPGSPGSGGIAPQFDWYSATIDDSPSSVERTLAVALGADPVAATPMHGYEHGRDLRSAEGHVLAKLLYGGSGNNGRPHVIASGDDARELAGLIRSVWPARLAPGSQGGHYVTRMDAAIDYDDAEAWGRLYGIAVDLAKQKNLRLGTVGDWITPDDERVHGRTLYVGSPSSDVQVRLYEKGMQQREALADPLEAAMVSRNWIRLEVRVRPQRDARHRAATSTPAEAFGYALWTRDLLQQVEGLDVERVAMDAPRETDDERAISYMVQQYGKTMTRLAMSVGGWDALGRDLEARAARLGIDTRS